MSISLEVKPIRDTEIFYWTKKLLQILSQWPESPNNFRFFMYLGYFTIFAILTLISCFQQSVRSKFIRNLTEFVAASVGSLKLILFHLMIHKLLPIIKTIRQDASEGYYKTLEEKKIVRRYCRIGDVFSKVLPFFAFIVPVLFFIRPMADIISSRYHNTPFSYNMPFQIGFANEMRDPYIYTLAYVCQILLPLTFLMNRAPDSLLITLILYVCGQLSVLRMRIRNVNSDLQSYKSEMRSLVEKHEKFIQMARSVGEIYNTFLFVQMLSLTFALCISTYQLLTELNDDGDRNVLTYILFTAASLSVLFSYCYVGECLIYESTSMSEAYYDSKWYELPAEFAQPIILCIARSHIPIYLSAGKFSVYSLETFAVVLKTAMGYLSVMRSVMENSEN